MATKYFVTFKNETSQPSVVQFCVYQEYPELPGLKSVAWKKAGAYMGGQATVEWVITYAAVLSNYNDEGGIGIYSSSQTVEAQFKDQFDITDETVRNQSFQTFLNAKNFSLITFFEHLGYSSCQECRYLRVRWYHHNYQQI